MRSAMNAPISAVSLPPASDRAAPGFGSRTSRPDRRALRDARIEIPAVVVEPRRVGDVPDPGEVLSLDFAEPDDDVGDLNAEIVDVVLHFHRRVPEREHARQRVAERGVSQMADVRRLVRVDGRVLDDRFVGSRAGGGRFEGRRQGRAADSCQHKRAPIE